MKNEISSIIDGKEAYAYGWMKQEGEYAHMKINIRLAAPEGSYRRTHALLQISCQIGGGSAQSDRPYAMRYGLTNDYEQLTLKDVELAVKVMRKIERHLDKCNERDGYSEGYAEFCHRVLTGSGVVHFMTEPGDGWATGGRMENCELFKVGASGRSRLVEMQDALIARFARKVA